jgi:hypothetical protein
VVNLVVPIAAHELDYRYVLSAVPFACLAFGLTFGRRRVVPSGEAAETLPAVDEARPAAGGAQAATGETRASADGTPPEADGRARATTGEAPAGTDGTRDLREPANGPGTEPAGEDPA